MYKSPYFIIVFSLSVLPLPPENGGPLICPEQSVLYLVYH